MKRWLSMVVCAILVFTLIPTSYAQHSGQASHDHKEKGKKKEKVQKASGKVTTVDAANGKIVLEVKGKSVELVVTATTNIRISDVKAPALSDIWVGDKISAEYTTENNVNTAKKLSVFKQKGSLKGQVEAVDIETHTLTVAGKQLVVTKEAVIFLKNEKITFEDIVKGDKIEAKGFIKEGILQVFSLKIKREDDVVKGEVESINLETKTITVDEKQIVITEQTKILLNGKEAKVEEILVDDKLVAIGTKSEDVFTAKVINVVRKAVEIEGQIESIDMAASSFVIGGKNLLVTEKTKFESDDKEIRFSDLLVGDFVEAKAWKKSETEWIVVKLELKRDDHKNKR